MNRMLLPAVLACLWPAAAPAAPPTGGAVVIERAFPGLKFENPLFLTAAPGDAGRLYVVTQGGKIFGFEGRDEVESADVFLDLSARVRAGGEEGLLGLAFHPGFAKNRRFYVYYTPRGEPRRTVIEAYRARDVRTADPASGRILLTIEQPWSNHNGGMLAFGPDGMLYAAPGDGGSAGDPKNHAQRLDNLLGKVLRLTPDGGIPPDNPFVGTPGARGEIWAYGLRNPWRFSFDRETGELWAADVGQNAWEEINVIRRGGNHGWRLFEGTHAYRNPDRRPASDFVAPVHEYGHDLGQSITGGYVYRGARVPGLRGAYVYGDFVSGRVWALKVENGRVAWNREIGKVPFPSSFGEDAAGELYVTSFDGGIYRFAPSR